MLTNYQIKIFVALLLFMFLFESLQSQKSFTISGTIHDTIGGEQMQGVSIHEHSSKKSIVSNYYGFYSITIPKGSVTLTYSYIGHKTDTVRLNILHDTTLNIFMKPENTFLNQVIIKERISNPGIAGQISMKMEQIRNAPVLLGESDLLKTIQFLPGVKGGIEGTDGIYVRGGSPDQNLILLDGVPIYNISHFFGFFSVFNTDVISGFTFYKGGMPARYEGRLSSVLDIKMKEGNNQKLGGEASLGLISSKFTLEGPFGGKNTSFIISARRTFVDLLTLPFRMKNSEADPVPGYYFYDITAKINHKFNNRNHLYTSIYIGKDYAGTHYKGSSGTYNSQYKSSDGFGWGNLTAAFRWNWQISKKLFSNLTCVYSNYNFKIESKRDETQSSDGILDHHLNRYTSGINDAGIKWNLEFYSAKNYTLRTGANLTRHTFNPGVTLLRNRGDTLSTDIDTTFGNRKLPVNDFFAFLENELKISEKLITNVGIQYSIFTVEGKNYTSVQPRLSLEYRLSERILFRTSYGKVSQYLHLLTNSTIGLPTDLWLPATSKIKPQEAWQYSAGIYFQTSRGYTINLEGYLKEMENLIDYKEGSSFYQINSSWEDKVEIGRGSSKGLEIFFQKTTGKLTGWIGTTISRSTRKFQNLNFGREFPFRYDSWLDLSMLANYQLNEKIRFDAAWTFHTGNAVTLALEKIPSFTDTTSYYRDNVKWIRNTTSVNNFRTPVYHRLDIGIDLTKRKKHLTRTWSIGIYNIYNRLNPFYLYPEIENGVAGVKQYSLFPALPYVRYSVRF